MTHASGSLCKHWTPSVHPPQHISLYYLLRLEVNSSIHNPLPLIYLITHNNWVVTRWTRGLGASLSHSSLARLHEKTFTPRATIKGSILLPIMTPIHRDVFYPRQLFPFLKILSCLRHECTARYYRNEAFE